MRISDWSSTCALPISALQQSGPERPRVRHVPPGHRHAETRDWPSFQVRATLLPEPSAIWAWWRHDRDTDDRRSEERRVGKSGSVSVDLGGRRIIKKTKKTQ